MSQHDELRQLCALYALGALEAPDRARLEAHLRAGCPECAAELAVCTEGVLALAASAPQVEPDPALRKRLMEAIAAEPGPAGARERSENGGAGGREAARPAAGGAGSGQPARVVPAAGPAPDARERQILRFPLVAAVGWAAAIAFAILGAVEQRAVRDLQAQLGVLRVRQAELEMRLEEERRWAATMASPAARVALLGPTSAGKKGFSGWALYHAPSRRAIVVLENLERDPLHDFELWAIGPGGPRSLGVIQVDASGGALVRLPRIADTTEISAFAVSYEAKGGSPNRTAPAGPVVMIGNI